MIKLQIYYSLLTIKPVDMPSVVTDYGELFDKWNQIQRGIQPPDATCEEQMKPFLPLIASKPSTTLSMLYDFLNFFNTYLTQFSKSGAQNEVQLQLNAIKTIKHKIKYVSQNKPIAPYKIHGRKIYFLPHGGMGDHITMIAAIRYYSMIYDEVMVGVRDKYADNIRRIYGDDPSIQVHGFSWPYGDDTCRRVSFLDHFRSLGYEILVPSVCCWGGRTGGKPSPDGIAFYRAFYIQSDLNYDLRWKFSHINRNFSREIDLYKRLGLENQPYVFVHGDESVLDQAKSISGGMRIVYPEGSMLDYCTIIERANGVFMMDSSFFCLCTILSLQAKQKYVYVRTSSDNAILYNRSDSRYMSPTDHWTVISPIQQPSKSKSRSRLRFKSQSRSKSNVPQKSLSHTKSLGGMNRRPTVALRRNHSVIVTKHVTTRQAPRIVAVRQAQRVVANVRQATRRQMTVRKPIRTMARRKNPVRARRMTTKLVSRRR